jgi:uncharacterized protein (TIGR02145 family)
MIKYTLFLACSLLFVLEDFAQSNIPQLVNFSAVVRDANNNLVVNTTVSLRLSFRGDGAAGPLVYCALHEAETNQNGFISIQINREVLATGCNGAPSTAFEDIAWEQGNFWMEVEYQSQPGDPFENLGQLELSSSFYAFAAQSAERLTGFSLEDAVDGDILRFNLSSGQWEAVAPDSLAGFSGNYADLADAPESLSAFENDMGYISEFQNLSASATGDTLYLSQGNWIMVPGISVANAPPAAPNINTLPLIPFTDLSPFSAVLKGSIVSANNAAITEKGFCWNTSGEPTLADDTVINESVGSSLFTNTITGLEPDTEYHFRAYAVNSIGVGYGNTVSFTMLGEIFNPALTYGTVSDVAGQAYATIAIGNQLWMAENLRTAIYSNGDSIPQVSGPVEWGATDTGAWCHLDNDLITGQLYGKLYNAYAVVDPRGLCPAGWSAASANDWVELIEFIDPNADGSSNTAGPAFRSAGQMIWQNAPNSPSTNASGFSALPGSYRHQSGSFFDTFNSLGWFWSGTSPTSGMTTSAVVGNNDALSLPDSDDNSGLSVRCIQD